MRRDAPYAGPNENEILREVKQPHALACSEWTTENMSPLHVCASRALKPHSLLIPDVCGGLHNHAVRCTPMLRAWPSANEDHWIAEQLLAEGMLEGLSHTALQSALQMAAFQGC